MNHQIGLIDNRSSPEDKIALFRSLFRGRDDVYPRRFESRRTGKSGYQPACANEWIRDVCEKPRVKCAECPHRRFLPVTDDVIRWHLSGQSDDGRDFVMGVYPMFLDETCFFLAVDFDKAHWREDVAVFLETCRTTDLPVALELPLPRRHVGNRSRSGSTDTLLGADGPFHGAGALCWGAEEPFRGMDDRFGGVDEPLPAGTTRSYAPPRSSSLGVQGITLVGTRC